LSPKAAAAAHADQTSNARLISLSLDTWGSKAFSSQAHQSFDSRVGLQGSVMLRDTLLHLTSYLSKASSSTYLKLLCVLLMAVAFAGLIIAFWADCSGSDNGSPLPSPTLVSKIESMSGPWSSKYRDSSVMEKQAIALLFKCDITSPSELSDSQISEEHISECIWIAHQMLGRKSFEEWVALSQQNRMLFQDSVAATFAEHAATFAEHAEHAESSTNDEDSNYMNSSDGAVTVDNIAINSAQRTAVQAGTARLSVPPHPYAQVGMSPVPVLNCVAMASVSHPKKSPAPVSSLPFKSPVPMLDCGREELEPPKTSSSMSSTAPEQVEDELFSALMSGSAAPSVQPSPNMNSKVPQTFSSVASTTVPSSSADSPLMFMCGPMSPNEPLCSVPEVAQSKDMQNTEQVP
jgi:hypothetical protein